MALDALLTKTAAPNAANTFYPTGPIQVGGSNVDEFDLYVGNKGIHSHALAAVLYVPVAPTGTLPTLDVTLESDDNIAFTSAQTRLTAKQITGTSGRNANGSGKFFLFWVLGIPERYVRFKLVAGGTTPDWGTVTVGLEDGQDDSYLY